MNIRRDRPYLAALAAVLSIAVAQSAPAQMPAGGLPREAEDQLSHTHPEYLGALSPENLKKPRPKPPFDLTGTWFVDLRKSFADFMFGPPYPEFFEPGQTALKEAAQAMKDGKPYRDSIGECYPAGMPMIMTRVWPINMIQLPTGIFLTAAFTNSLRIIYLDGRKHTDPDIVVQTYNGESIGHWEGDALVVDTRYMEPNQHYIDMGIPVSDQFRIIERIRMIEKGEALQIDYTMTDPKMWEGEWRSTKRFIRKHYSDIPEVECLPNLNKNLPSTEEGQAALDERAK